MSLSRVVDEKSPSAPGLVVCGAELIAVAGGPHPLCRREAHRLRGWVVRPDVPERVVADGIRRVAVAPQRA